MPEVVQFDGLTREITERDYTQEELEQLAIEQTYAQAEAQKEAAERQARLDAIAHATSLGFTDDMIAVMYPGLTV